MKSDKDIFDLFRENEHRLSESPSPRAWERLEQRLETNTQKTQVTYYRQLSIAASIVALLAVVFLISNYIRPNHTNLAMNASSTMLLEDLGATTDNEIKAYKTIEFVRKHQSRLANPIEEGTTDRKLKPVKK